MRPRLRVAAGLDVPAAYARIVPLNRKAGDKRLVDMSPPLPAWTPELPALEPDYEQHFLIGPDARYTQRHARDKYTRLVEWAVMQHRRINGKWVRVAVYDVCHGKGFHVHRYDRNGAQFAEQPIHPVDSYADSEQALQCALDRVVESWEENERRSDLGH